MSARLLLALDGSPAADRALELFAGYAGDREALALELLNVQARPVSLWPGAGLAPGVLEEALRAAGQEVLAPAQARLAAAGFAPRVAVRLGFAAEGILHEARTRQCDAIVAGTRGTGLVQGYALGSVALRIVHGAAAPVLLVTPEARLPRTLGRRTRVLLAMDGSAPALRAAERLLAWRGWLGSLEVHLAYVQPALAALQAMLPPHEDVLRQWSGAEAEEATRAARERLAQAGVALHAHARAGEPARELALLAQETQSDLVALGTRGLGAAHHALVGSVALKAAAACGVPALLVS